MTLLEFTRDHHREIEVLQDGKALFVLTFINELGKTNRDALIAHLGWDGDELDGLLKLLTEAELIRNVRGFDPTNPIRPAANGLAMISALHFPRKSNELLERSLRAQHPPLKIMVLGEQAAGKSTLINSLFRPERVTEEPADLELFKRAQAGDRVAADSFFRKYASVAFREAFSVLRQEEDAEDAAQRTFVKLLTKSFDFVDRPIKPFIRSVAHHTALDLREEKSRRQEEPIEKHDPPQTDIASTWFQEEHALHIRELFTRMLADVGLRVHSPSLLVEQQELADSLRRALQRLTDSERLIFALSLQGLPTDQIAERLHTTPNAVLIRRYRVVQKLRRYLQESGQSSGPAPDEE